MQWNPLLVRALSIRLAQRFSRPTDSSTLSSFRILFGLLMLWQVWNFYHRGTILSWYIQPDFYFTMFDFIQPLPAMGIYGLFLLWAVSALLLVIGFHSRLAATGLFFSFTYLFLLDKSNYNNHYYLISLLAFLFIITGAHRSFSVDAMRTRCLPYVPYWQLFIFKFQILVVFFFAGAAKINLDWLSGRPLDMWFAERAPELGPWVLEAWAPLAIAFGVLIFEFALIPLVLWKRTRILVAIPYILFNLFNKWMFGIGIFPWISIAALILFFDPASYRSLINKIFSRKSKNIIKPVFSMNNKITVLLVVYIVLQILIPLRHLAIPGHVHWTTEGQYFSWQMKANSRELGSLRMDITDLDSGEFKELMFTDLTDRQRRKMADRPHMILQYAHHVRHQYTLQGTEHVDIRAHVFISLNGRPFLPTIDEHVNLALVEYDPWRHNDWITDLPR